MITTDFYTLVSSDGSIDQVDADTAEKVANAIEDNIFKKLWIEDIVGARTMLRIEDVCRIYHNSPEIRQRIKEHNKIMRAEDPSWES